MWSDDTPFTTAKNSHQEEISLNLSYCISFHLSCMHFRIFLQFGRQHSDSGFGRRQSYLSISGTPCSVAFGDYCMVNALYVTIRELEYIKDDIPKRSIETGGVKG